MATLAQIRRKAAESATKARARISAGARDASVRARSFGRAISTGASKERESFCQRTAPPPAPMVVRLLMERAIGRAAPKLGYSADQFAIVTEDQAANVAAKLSSKARGNRLAKQVYKMALAWSWWLADKRVNDLRDAYRYAQDALDEASR